MNSDRKRQQQRYDHRLRKLVRLSGNPDLVAHLGVPRSAANSWLNNNDDRPVITDQVMEMATYEL